MNDQVVLLGHAIGYSASPAMHDAAFVACGLDWRYLLREVPPDGLGDAVADLRAPGARGANVTIPHKVSIMSLLDELDPVAARIGAANAVVPDGGRLVGHNTDMPALAAELAELLVEGRDPPDRAVVLGGGGAARAALAALADAGVPQLTSVTRDRWHELPTLVADAQLLVNATPIGTGSDDTPVAADLLRPDLSILDLVYRPDPTRLVREARRTGAVARGGAGMLLRQAAASFELWTGLPAPIEAMRAALEAELHAATHA